MAQIQPTSTSSTNFETIFTAALEAYKKQTKKAIASHPLATQLQSCDSPSAIIALLQTQVDQSQSADEKWTKWLDPTVNVLYAFSATLGSGAAVVSPIYRSIVDLLPDECDYRYSRLQMRFSLGSVCFFK